MISLQCFWIGFGMLLASDSIFVITLSIAWLIGWALILEYTIGGSTVARGISPNLVQCIFI